MRRWLTWSAAAALTALFVWQAGTALAEPSLIDEAHPAYVLQERAGASTVTLKVGSPQSGANVLRVRVETGGAIDPTVDQVRLYPNMPGHDMLLLAASVPTTRTAEGEFRADTGVFEMFGTWDLVVEMNSGVTQRTAAFHFPLAPSRPQIALFAGVPLTLLALGLIAVIVMWRQSAGAPEPSTPAAGTGL
ncbi:MAG: hypothetical protein EXR52_07905 [Dehalococcoidia bacterium]|nr:hypothetical protein [Dehalococcoidia bacterium]